MKDDSKWDDEFKAYKNIRYELLKKLKNGKITSDQYHQNVYNERKKLEELSKKY
jgi:hypothetical protein